MASKPSEKKSLRIHFSDGTYCTVRITNRTTVKQICQKFCPRKGLDPELHTLKVCETVKGSSFERWLMDFENPADIISEDTGSCRFKMLPFNPDEESSEEEFSHVMNISSHQSQQQKKGGNRTDITDMGYQKEGLMEKLGVETMGIRFSYWRTNFFVLDGDTLVYWKTKEEFKKNRKYPRGTLELQKPWAYVQVNENKTEENKFEFQLITSTKIIYLRVDTYQDLVQWSNALTRPPPPDNQLFEVLQNELESTENTRADELEIWIKELSNMDTLLRHRQANDAFLKYLRNDDLEHWLLFVIDVEVFEDCSEEVLLLHAEKLFNQYVNNIYHPLPQCTKEMKKDFSEQILEERVTQKMFDELLQGVKTTLRDDFFPKFINSSYFHSMICRLKFRRKLWPPDLKG